MREQAEKLGKALFALRRIAAASKDEVSKALADDTLKEIAQHGKDPKDL